MAKGLAGFCFIYAALPCLAAPAAGSPPRAGEQSSQFFARGIELDFGSDFAMAVGAIPLNTPSHIRGPGHLDSSLLIPELAGGCRYVPGFYQAGQGGFAVAGSASLELVPAGRFLALGWGGARTDRFGRLLWADADPDRGLCYGLELVRKDRPWDDLTGSARLNANVRKDGEGFGGRWSFTALGSEDRSDGGAARPLRPEPAEALGSLGTAKAGDGAWNQRLLLGWRLDRPGGRLDLYGGAQHERIWNSWTFYLRDPVRGDQLEQVDRRMFLGAHGLCNWDGGIHGGAWRHTLGAQFRADQVTAAEVWPTAARVRVASPIPGLAARGRLLQGALYGQSTLAWAGCWQAFLGLRLDAQHNAVSELQGPWRPAGGSLVLGSPRAGLSCAPDPGTLLSLQGGWSCRPGDAFREPRPLLRVRGGEFSAQTRPRPPWTCSLTLWSLDLESESLFDAPGNTFRAAGAARHQGLEAWNEVKAGSWRLELAWAWTRAAFLDLPAGADRVPGAVPETGFLGVAWEQSGTSLGARFRRAGGRPLDAGGIEAERQDLVELRIQQRVAAWSITLEVLNAFSRKTYNHEYLYISRLPGEPDLGRLDRHIKPANPQTIRLELRRRF